MKTKNETELLSELIDTTKKKRAYELEVMKDELHGVCESLKPLNIIKHVFHEVTSSPELKEKLTSNAVGMGTGFLLKKVLIRSPRGLGKKVLGTVIQFGVAHFVSKHFEEIKLLATHFFNRNVAPEKAEISK